MDRIAVVHNFVQVEAIVRKGEFLYEKHFRSLIRTHTYKSLLTKPESRHTVDQVRVKHMEAFNEEE